MTDPTPLTDDELAEHRRKAEACGCYTCEPQLRLLATVDRWREEHNQVAAERDALHREAAVLRQQRDKAEKIVSERGEELDRLEADIEALRASLPDVDDSDTDPAVWCWEDRRDFYMDPDSKAGTCTLPEGHDGPHEFTDDDQITVRFAPAPPEPVCGTCNDTGCVPVSSRGSDGFDPCPDCGPQPDTAPEEKNDATDQIS